MSLLLAPMEGLLDFMLRDVLTRAGGISRCVGEFIRVTNTLLPERVFYRVVPELHHGGFTPAGVPVRGQLLGSDPACLADNAARLASLSAHGVDLNFGCPAKVVNRHGGGAALLDDPELLHRIVAAVRRAVPAGLPVSAKMRLGTADDRRAVECAQALVEGGADELVVHARTKADGYRPPARWERLADIRAAVAVPVVANGEIWTVADALRCRELSGCDALMLGRGMVADPGLALAIVAGSSGNPPGLDWAALMELLAYFWGQVQQHIHPRHRAGRVKQWLNLLRRRHPEAEQLHAELRTETDSRRLAERLFARTLGPAPGVAAQQGRYTGHFPGSSRPMAVSSKANASAFFDLKSTDLSVLAVWLKTADLTVLGQALQERCGEPRTELFEHEPACIDLSALRDSEVTLDVSAVLALLRSYGLNPVAVRSGSAAQIEAFIAAGLVQAPDPVRRPRVEAQQEFVPPEASAPSTEPQPSAALVVAAEPLLLPESSTDSAPYYNAMLVVDKPLRSGMKVYARGGDLVVIGIVSYGAEVAADGNIHVYGPLRGRALAGARGDVNARIFATSMEPQLVSIAGHWRTMEEGLPENVTKKPAQARLEGSRLVFEPMNNT